MLISVLFGFLLPLVIFGVVWALHINSSKADLVAIYWWCLYVAVVAVYFAAISGYWIGSMYAN